jgi:hypothetical protein
VSAATPGTPARAEHSRRRPAAILLAVFLGLGALGGVGGAALGGIASDGPEGHVGTHLEHFHGPGDRLGSTP